MRYTENNTTVYCIATLLGCNPSAGLVNDLNDIHDEGGFDACVNLGEQLRVLLRWKLAQLDERSPPRADRVEFEPQDERHHIEDLERVASFKP